MKATLRYTLPDENADFLAASRASSLLGTLETIDNICRNEIKHGSNKTKYEVVEQIRNEIWDELVYHQT